MKIGKRLYQRYGPTVVLVALAFLMAACTNDMPPSEIHPASTAAAQSEEGTANDKEWLPVAKESVQMVFLHGDQDDVQATQETELPEEEPKRDPVEAVLGMYEALQANDSKAYFRLADIPSIRISPAKLKLTFEEAGKREVKPERFKLFDKAVLDSESSRLLSLTYGSQAEIVLEELSQGDFHIWFVTAFTDGLKVVEQSTVYPGAYELGREAELEELVAEEIRRTAEDRGLLAARAKEPLWNPVQSVSLLYQAAQAEDEETFFAMSGGDEGYFAGQHTWDMSEFSETMKSVESVQQMLIKSVSRGNIAETYIAEYDKRFGSDWQFIVAWNPEDGEESKGTSWIMAPSGDGTRYVVKQTLTGNLDPFLK
ncbi:hypothetical protein [Paenibacillus solani]|uniref:hypothetical protein n=1 Tax=Paenibacillus solani TaxID=1705565 RepID=UPI000AE9F887|nr:hypothetical protein [Paenibacillus solani]